ncbi:MULTISPECIES: HlyD family secretion protein [unclassified Shewanella]|uniref:HlyD family secretion protein n=1 Tax=unclassified Shewanella TaxID=196818 RepID=UPI001BC17B63|nr:MULTISPECIES: HlyD family secretion protein [unclassified Shewanella]GIU15289.1 hemolysin D [Shewanella sp. MBTL60-112-B1]GIU34724.1 hemolysin D [Shewanella sp. MBTL60-112-B2]
MKDKIYQYISYAVLSLAVLFSLFLVTTDNIAPFTTQAAVHKNVATIASEVEGVVTQVYVKNGQQVNKGQSLFAIEQSRYLIAVKQAQAELDQALESNSAKGQQLVSAEQLTSQRTLEKLNASRKMERYESLLKQGTVTQQELEDAQLAYKVSVSTESAAKAEVKRIQVELATEQDNAAIELAKAKLAQAQLSLEHTVIKAKLAGSVSNLQLQTGSYLAAGASAMFVVNEQDSWLSADFNEKGIAHLKAGARVAVVFDALPGKVFQGKIINQDSAIYDSSSQLSQLADVTNSDSWIREQQKIRTRISVNEQNPQLISGSRASVMVENGNWLVDTCAKLWMHLVSYFHYIY